MTLSIKHIRLLHQQKYRKLHKQFIAEGIKCINDIISLGYKPCCLLYDKDRFVPNNFKEIGEKVDISTLKKVSIMKTPPAALAVFSKFYDEHKHIDEEFLKEISNDNIIFLDNISDPGNLGTIIRTADWFGFRNIICSNNTVEIYNPKVVQATMGAIANVKIRYTDTDLFLSMCQNNNMPIFGLDMHGLNIRELDISQKAIFIIGNEANGITQESKKYVSSKLSIEPVKAPNNGSDKVSESLNAAISFAILCYSIRG